MINKDTNTIKKQKERTLIMKSTKATNKIVSLLLVMAMLTSVFCIPQPSVHAETEETTTVTNTKPQAEKITKRQKMRLFMGMEQEKNVRRSMHRISDSKMKKEN